MTKEEKSKKINDMAREGCNKDELILLVSDYYIRDVLEIEPSDERDSVNVKNRKGCNAENLMKAIIYAVNKYDPIYSPNISLLQLVGDTITDRQSDIFPKWKDDIILEPEDKKPSENIKKYWKLMNAMKKMEIDVNKITNEQIERICKETGIPEEKFNVIMRAGSIKNADSLEFIVNDGESLETQIAADFDEFDNLELKLWLMSWFVWLAQNGRQEKQKIYKMINTNGVLAIASSPLEFPDHTDRNYYKYAVTLEYIDATIVKYLNHINIIMSKQNFYATYKKPYNDHYYMQYIKEK